MAGEIISKSQADRLGEELRHEEITADRIERLSAYREQLVRDARSAAETIRAQTLYPVTPREGKSTGSIVAKLRRQPIALSRMQDIVGCSDLIKRLEVVEHRIFRNRTEVSAQGDNAELNELRILVIENLDNLLATVTP